MIHWPFQEREGMIIYIKMNSQMYKDISFFCTVFCLIVLFCFFFLFPQDFPIEVTKQESWSWVIRESNMQQCRNNMIDKHKHTSQKYGSSIRKIIINASIKIKVNPRHKTFYSYLRFNKMNVNQHKNIMQ